MKGNYVVAHPSRQERGPTDVNRLDREPPRFMWVTVSGYVRKGFELEKPGSNHLRKFKRGGGKGRSHVLTRRLSQGWEGVVY